MVFISYSRDTYNELQLLLSQFDKEGINYWIDSSKIPVSEAFVKRIAEGLWEANSFLLIDSIESRASYWVKKELSLALRYFKQGHYKAIIRIFKNEIPSSSDIQWSLSVPLDNLNIVEIVRFLKNNGEPSEPHPLVNTNANSILSYDTQIRNWLGRQGNLQRLDEWWEHGKTGVCIIGPPQLGKTALVYTWMSILVHLILDTNKFHLVRIQDQELFSGESDIKNVLDEFYNEYGTCLGLIYIDDLSSYNEKHSIADIVDAIFRHPIKINKRIIVSTRNYVGGYDFDVHEIDSITPPIENLGYLTNYGISKNLAYEIHKVVSKYPQLLTIFEHELSMFLPDSSEIRLYRYLEEINKGLATIK